MIRSTPMINTARLTLCAMRPEDFPRYAEIWSAPQNVQQMCGSPRSRGEAWTAFLRNAGHWHMTGFGQWALIQQSSRRMIGQAGFFYSDRALGEDFDQYPEAGWILAPEMQGQGLGYEAAQAAHDWFDRVIPGPLVTVTNAENEASCKLAQKLGYTLLREAEYEGKPVHLFRRNGPPVRH